MACGCAIIASQAGPCAELTEGAALLADPYDPADFADKIMRMVHNEGLKKDLRQKSLERTKFFNWQHTARLTLEVLTKTVNGAA